MKKLLFTIGLLPLSVLMFAQGVGVGIKAGANFANLATDNYSTNSIISYHVGLFANLNISEKFGVTPEVLWSAQGAEIDDAELNTNFVTVPIMLRWRIIDLISLEAGPQFNFLTNAELDGDDFSDKMKNNAYSVAVGAVVHLPAKLHGGVRYVIGMSDLSESDDDELKERTFQVYVGWTLFGAN